MYSNQVIVKIFLQYIRKIAHGNNQLQKHKRGLSKRVAKIQDFIECFKAVDLDKKGVIYPNILQNYLISKKYFHNPVSISRYYSKYSHQKKYLGYQDILQSLLPSADYILLSSTITQQSPKKLKHKYSCRNQSLQIVDHLTAFIISQEIRLFDQDYSMMKNITKGSQSIGATLWRLLDRNHNNELNFQKISQWANQLGFDLSKQQWESFLYWQFHSYKKTISRNHFMSILNIHEERKRASSACKIDQYKIQSALFKKAEQDRARNIRIESAVKEKIALVSGLQRQQYLNIMGEQHFEYSLLNRKRILSGKKGYSNAQNLVKYTVERP